MPSVNGTVSITIDGRAVVGEWRLVGDTLLVQAEFGSASEVGTKGPARRARRLAQELAENHAFGGTPVSFLRRAEGLRDDARKLVPTEQGWRLGFASDGVYLLITNSIEVALKAAWLAKGAFGTMLREVGHDLVKLLAECPELDLSEDTRELITWLSPSHVRRDFTYANRIGLQELPTIQALMASLDELVEKVAPICHAAQRARIETRRRRRRA